MEMYTNPNRVATAAFFQRMQSLRAAKALADENPTSLAKKSPTAPEAAFNSESKKQPYTFGNAVGFLTSYTKDHRARIIASEFTVVDAETTGLTAQSKPISVGGSAKIGPESTWSNYKKLVGEGAGLNCSVRMRVWSIQLSDGSRLAWDLDKLGGVDVKNLLVDSVHDKIVIGHNLAFDFNWVISFTGRRSIKPRLVLDTMLIARCIKPASVYSIHRLGAKGDEAAQAVIGKSGNASASLAAIAVGLGMEEPDKSWQHPRNWAVSHLSAGHYDYVLGDIDAPLEIIRTWTRTYPETPFAETLAKLRALDAALGGSYFAIYEKVPMALAKISHTGMPLHVPTVEAVRSYRVGQMPGLISSVIEHMPPMAEYLAKLEARSPATSAEMKKVLGDYAAANDCKLDEADDGTPVINAKSAKMKGAADLAGWKAWEQLQSTKKLLSLCDEYSGIASTLKEGQDPDFRRLRPLLSARTATGRVASQVPNVMNLPRPGRMPSDFMPEESAPTRAERWAELQFRAVVRAPAGHTLISADYGQIELRIAAALALRAIRDAKASIVGEIELPESKKWFLEALRWGEDIDAEIPVFEDEEKSGFEGFRARIARVWRKLSISEARPMADAFRAGVDPHLLTGITLAARQGLVDLAGSHPIEWLKANKSDESALKKRFAAQRQSAKALNFGLLYGMQAEKLYTHGIVDYGLSWSLEDAEDSRTAWFELFPEIEFLQMWHQLVLMPGKKEAEPMFRRNPYSKQLQIENVRVGAASTLRGRPVVATEAREILNYSDQGSGADMLLEAVTSMSDEAFDCIIDLIHDEVLMCVPLEKADRVQAELERAMLASADSVLAPWGIPAEAEGARMLFWKKD